MNKEIDPSGSQGQLHYLFNAFAGLSDWHVGAYMLTGCREQRRLN